MTSQCNRFNLIYNGELYNYLELREELIKRGFAFKSNSDTEVVLNALIEWGSKAVLKFNGIFALAFWDSKEQKLMLARDRFGVKPLYFVEDRNGLYFASEIKALLEVPTFKRELNLEAVSQYFTFQNQFGETTFLNNVRLLEQGSILIKQRADKTSEIRSYWKFTCKEPEQHLSHGEYLEQLQFLFDQAVKRQTISDVNIGAFLSGGIDSGAITAVATKVLDSMNTFTCGFDLSSASGIELNFDEREAAETISALFQTDQYEVVLKSGDMEKIMKDIVYHLEEPRVGQCYPNFYVSKLASKFNKVVLAGTGGDELFGGYPWRYFVSSSDKNTDEFTDLYFTNWQRLVNEGDKSRFFEPVWTEISQFNMRETFKEQLSLPDSKTITQSEMFNCCLNFEIRTFLQGLLMIDDKLSMAHSLETRVPFLDNDLAEFAANLPLKHKTSLNTKIKLDENVAGHKTALYYQRTKNGKLLLREAMSKFLPKKITEREKQGFSAPDASWFRGQSIDFVRDTICTPNSKIYDYLDYGFVNRLLEEHFSGKKNKRLLIWSLIYFDNFLNQFLCSNQKV